MIKRNRVELGRRSRQINFSFIIAQPFWEFWTGFLNCSEYNHCKRKKNSISHLQAQPPNSASYSHSDWPASQDLQAFDSPVHPAIYWDAKQQEPRNRKTSTKRQRYKQTLPCFEKSHRFPVHTQSHGRLNESWSGNWQYTRRAYTEPRGFGFPPRNS